MFILYKTVIKTFGKEKKNMSNHGKYIKFTNKSIL